MSIVAYDAMQVAAGLATWILRHGDLLLGWPGLLLLGVLLIGTFMFKRGA